MVQESRVVDLEKARQRRGSIVETSRRERALDQHARAFADHPPDRVFRKRRGAELTEQLIGRIGEVAARVDERPVEIERDQAT